MPIDQVQSAVEAFIAANWTTTDVAYENTGYVPTSDSNGSVLPWVLIEVFGGLYDQRSIGAGSAAADYWQDCGTVWLHIFVGSGTGSLLAKQYAAAFAQLFRGLELDPNITFGDINLGASGTSDGNDWTMSVSIAWEQG